MHSSRTTINLEVRLGFLRQILYIPYVSKIFEGVLYGLYSTSLRCKLQGWICDC